MTGFLNATSFAFTRCAPELLKHYSDVYGNLAWHGLSQGLIEARDKTITAVIAGVISAGLVLVAPKTTWRIKLLGISAVSAGTASLAAHYLYPSLSLFSSFATGWDQQYWISLAQIAAAAPHLDKNCLL